MSLALLLDKDVIFFLLQQRWSKFKKDFWANGGFSNPKHLFLIFVFFWALHTFARERGWLRKKSVRGKHIFLTGAGSGLGRGMAIRFAKRGANLTLSDINEDGLLETKKMIKEETGSDTNVLTIKLDISNRQGIRDAAQQGLTKFGEVEIVINNAGIVQGKQFTELNESLSSKQFVVNLECHFWIVSEFLPSMIRRNSG